MAADLNAPIDPINVTLGMADHPGLHTEEREYIEAIRLALKALGPGIDGDDGASAYQVAVANGYTGTEAQWLASLKGAKGDPGTDAVWTQVTQAAYDAGPKTAGVLYVIVG